MYLSSITGFLFFLNDLFIFWPRHETCKIVVFQLGIKPLPPAVEAESPNHWTIREFQKKFLALKTREYKPKHRKIPTILLAFGDSRLLFLYINMIFLVNVISLFVTFFFHLTMS